MLLLVKATGEPTIELFDDKGAVKRRIELAAERR
jgi:hypothetical protein